MRDAFHFEKKKFFYIKTSLINVSICSVSRAGKMVSPPKFILKVTASLIFLSSYKQVEASVQSKSLANHNPLPYPMIVGNCLAWLLYSFLIKDYWVFFSNIGGIGLGLYYTLLVFGIASQDVYQKERTQIIQFLLGGVIFCFTGAFFAFVILADTTNAVNAHQKTMMGVVAIVELIMFYASPLSTLFQVIKTKNAEVFQWPLSVTCFLNACLWTFYGVALNDVISYHLNERSIDIYQWAKCIWNCSFSRSGKTLSIEYNANRFAASCNTAKGWRVVTNQPMFYSVFK